MRSLLILAAAPLAAQSWHVGQAPMQIFAVMHARASQPPPTVKESVTVAARPSLRISVSQQPVAALRAVSRERLPEATALYSVAICNLTASAMQIDARQVEQMIEAEGVAVMPRPLVRATVNRARSKRMRVAMTVLPMLRMLASAALGGGAARAFHADIGQHGPWLSDQQGISLAPQGCSPRLALMGSYRRGQAPALVIEVE